MIQAPRRIQAVGISFCPPFHKHVPCGMFPFTKRDVCGEIEDERSDKHELYAEVSNVSARRGL